MKTTLKEMLNDMLSDAADEIMEELNSESYIKQIIIEEIGKWNDGLYVNEDKNDTGCGEKISKINFEYKTANYILHLYDGFIEETSFDDVNERIKENVIERIRDEIKNYF